MPRLVMINRHLVHDLERNCPEMIKLAEELSQGRGCYTTVKATEVLVYKIPGCRTCFGSEPIFQALLQAM